MTVDEMHALCVALRHEGHGNRDLLVKEIGYDNYYEFNVFGLNDYKIEDGWHGVVLDVRTP